MFGWSKSSGVVFQERQKLYRYFGLGLREKMPKLNLANNRYLLDFFVFFVDL